MLLVSIQCLVYNHEPYLRQCLDGFVMQETNFKFEAIVHDDFSTDGSVEIIREYAEKYPDIIKPIFETENQYSKRDGSLAKIMNDACRGKYIALCEGDDYWTDSLKLQKQVDILEANPEYTMCFHNAIEHYEHVDVPDRLFSKIENKDYLGTYIFKNWVVPTASVVFRRSVIDSDLYNKVLNSKDFIYGDTPLFITCAELGKVRGIHDVMSVYRRNEGGVTQARLPFAWHLKYHKHILAFSNIFSGFYFTSHYVAATHLISSYIDSFKKNDNRRMMLAKCMKDINCIILGFSMISYFYNYVIRKLRR